MNARKTSLMVLLMFVIWIIPIVLPGNISIALRILLLVFLLIADRGKKDKGLFWIMLIYGVICLCSISFNPQAISFVLKTIAETSLMLSVYLGAEYIRDQNRFVNGLLMGSIIYFIIDAYYIFFTAHGTGINNDGQNLYFSGGKFQIGYLCIITMLLVLLKYKNIKWSYKLALVLISGCIAIKVDCTTALIAILVFGGIVLLPDTFFNKKTIVALIIIFIVLNYSIVLLNIVETNQYISYFVTNVLNKTIHLTGRSNIYSNISLIMRNHWLTGWGYSSNRITQITGLANMQNGFLQILYFYGLIGFSVFVVIMIIMIKKILNMADATVRKTIFGAFFAFCIASIVEIPFSSGSFCLLTGLITIYSENSYRNKEHYFDRAI